MDPLSISVAVGSLTTQALTCAKTLLGLQDIDSSATITNANICTETTSVSALLSQIQTALLSKQESISTDSMAVLDSTIISCSITYSCLDKEIKKLRPSGENDTSESQSSTRALPVWNESAMDNLLESIREQKTALASVLPLLQTSEERGNTDIAKVHAVKQTTGVAESLIDSYSELSIPRSTQEIDADSTLIDGTSAFSRKRFSFDKLLKRSKVYGKTNQSSLYGNTKGGASNAAVTTEPRRDIPVQGPPSNAAVTPELRRDIPVQGAASSRNPTNRPSDFSSPTVDIYNLLSHSKDYLPSPTGGTWLPKKVEFIMPPAGPRITGQELSAYKIICVGELHGKLYLASRRMDGLFHERTDIWTAESGQEGMRSLKGVLVNLPPPPNTKVVRGNQWVDYRSWKGSPRRYQLHGSYLMWVHNFGDSTTEVNCLHLTSQRLSANWVIDENTVLSGPVPLLCGANILGPNAEGYLQIADIPKTFMFPERSSTIISRWRALNLDDPDLPDQVDDSNPSSAYEEETLEDTIQAVENASPWQRVKSLAHIPSWSCSLGGRIYYYCPTMPGNELAFLYVFEENKGLRMISVADSDGLRDGHCDVFPFEDFILAGVDKLLDDVFELHVLSLGVKRPRWFRVPVQIRRMGFKGPTGIFGGSKKELFFFVEEYRLQNGAQIKLVVYSLGIHEIRRAIADAGVESQT